MPATVLTSELREVIQEIKEYARECGLDFFETFFEALPFDELNEVAAYDGFPTRYPHWRFGMQYEHLSKQYAYGLGKIYELVINNNPCCAYLMQGNSMTAQKLVVAHVYAHGDFFRHNTWFSRTNRKMIDEMANHATRVRKYAEKHGVEEIERFIDACLSIENLIDPHALFVDRKERVERPHPDDENPASEVPRLRARSYMERYINPPDFLEGQKKKLRAEKERRKKFPEEPVKDLLLFLMEHAPLAKWQQDVLEMIREEAYYFVPQRMTKIMNEGWATYWHSRLMTERIMTDAEVVDYADVTSATLGQSPGQINPYKLGLELFRDIEERWNQGRFGKEYDECADLDARDAWNKNLGLGRDKIFEVRKVHSDVTFIDAFLTEEFCDRHKLFTYDFNPHTSRYEISGRDFADIKGRLLNQLTNCGQPLIVAQDANYKNRGELLLIHRHHGVDLKLADAKETLANLHHLWRRPVHLETEIKAKAVLLSYDGAKHSFTERDTVTV
ncbi:MAG: SpoVR family protein [Planctomycetes bacterium]|nr:SpoVR family protein [Planctomycetota bacterium]